MKKIITLTLVFVAMLVCLTACGTTTPKVEATPTQSEVVETEPSPMAE